ASLRRQHHATRQHRVEESLWRRQCRGALGLCRGIRLRLRHLGPVYTRSLNSPPSPRPVTPRRPPASSLAQRRYSPPSKWTAIRFRSLTPCPRRSSRRSSRPRLSLPRRAHPSIMVAAGPIIVPRRTAFRFPRAKPLSAPFLAGSSFTLL